MTKKKTDEKEAAAAKTTSKKTTTPKTKESVVDDASKDSKQAIKEATESNETSKTNKDASKEKESLKSTENQSNENQDDTPKGMTFVEADILMNEGGVAKLPEWEGFWFKDMQSGETFVYTKDGEILDTPHEEYKDRNDWITTSPTEEQSEGLRAFWEKRKEVSVKESKKQAEDQAKLKAVAYNNGFGTSFRKLDKKISIEKLQSREDVPAEVPVNAEFLMDNAQVFNYAESQLTHRFENETLESIK